MDVHSFHKLLSGEKFKTQNLFISLVETLPEFLTTLLSRLVFYGFIQILPSPCWPIKVVSSLKLSSCTNGVVTLRKSHRLGSSCSFMATERIGDGCIELHTEIFGHFPEAQVQWKSMSLVTDYSTSSLNQSCAKLPSCVNITRKMGQLAWQGDEAKISCASNMHGWGYTVCKHGYIQKELLFPSPSELNPRAEFKNKYHYLKWTADSSASLPWLATHVVCQLQRNM